MINHIVMEIKRVFFRWKVFAAIIGVFLVWCIGSLKFPGEPSWLQLFCHIEGTTITVYLTMVIAAGVCSLGFCEDYEHNYHYLLIMRGSEFKYAVSKIMVAAISAFLIYVVGTMLYVIFVSIQKPFMLDQVAIENLQNSGCFGFLIPEHGWRFVIIQCFFDGMLCSILCCAAVCFSVWVPNKFTVFCIPLVFFWIQTMVTYSLLKLPAGFDWDVVFRMWATQETSKKLFIIKVVSNVIGYYLLFTSAMYYKVRRRCYYE